VAGKCIPAETEPAPEQPVPTQAKRKGKQTGKRSSEGEGNAFRPVDDAHIPSYDSKKTEVIDMKAGTERLSDAQVSAHMRKLDPALNACIATAAAHSEDDILPGRISLTFSIEPSGKVSSISAQAPAHLRVFGIVPCVRAAVYAHRFPSFDGSPMGAESSFTVQ
jgi:hypothetical protein